MIIIYIQRDKRGESASYTTWNYVEWNTDSARVHSIGGVRKDWRCYMWPQWRAVFSPMLQAVGV